MGGDVIIIIPDNDIPVNLKGYSGSPVGSVCLSHCDITCQGELLGTFNQSQLKMIAKISTASLVKIIKILLGV